MTQVSAHNCIGNFDHRQYDWRVDAPLGPWCVTWDIPNPWDDDLTRLARAVIATWTPVRMYMGELIPPKAKRYKKNNKNKLGEVWL